MIHHISINARDTDRVAAFLAEVLGGDVVAAPSPPFDSASRFVCIWDERGSMIEIGPWGATWQPDGSHQSDVVTIDDMPEHNYFHGLLMSDVSVDAILAACDREGWRAALVDNGPFRVVNVWLEDRQLLELTTPELLADYLATFGPANRFDLDGQLRGLEREILDALGQGDPAEATAGAANVS